MFVIVLDYVAPLIEVDEALEAHAAWLDTHYQSGLFLASGRREPRIGGVILAVGPAAEVEAAVASDPFAIRGIATHTVIEFHPSRLSGPLDVDGVRERVADAAPPAGQGRAAGNDPLAYRVLTGPDDSSFCERVSTALEEGYVVHGSPSVTFNGERVIVAQAIVLPSA